MKKKQSKERIDLYYNDKTDALILYNEETTLLETDYTSYKAGKYMLYVFDVSWVKVGEL